MYLQSEVYLKNFVCSRQQMSKETTHKKSSYKAIRYLGMPLDHTQLDFSDLFVIVSRIIN